MKAVWKAGVWAWATVTPVWMFCVADTPAAVTVVTALLTTMPGNSADRDAVRAAPLLVSAVDTDVGVAGPVPGSAGALARLKPGIDAESALTTGGPALASRLLTAAKLLLVATTATFTATPPPPPDASDVTDTLDADTPTYAASASV